MRSPRQRAIVVPKIYGDHMPNDGRLHVSLAISKDACFSAQMLNLFLLSFFSFSSAPGSPTRSLQGVLCPMYIPAGINFFMRHGARSVSGVGSSGSVVPASAPATSSVSSQTHLPTSSKSLFGICGVVGALLLGSYACASTGPGPPYAETVSQPSSFGRSVPSTSVERLELPGRRGIAFHLCMGLMRSWPSFPSRTQRMTTHLARVQC
jgi:hypothetical protein